MLNLHKNSRDRVYRHRYYLCKHVLFIGIEIEAFQTFSFSPKGSMIGTINVFLLSSMHIRGIIDHYTLHNSSNINNKDNNSKRHI
jgi:hypothetical protein